MKPPKRERKATNAKMRTVTSLRQTWSRDEKQGLLAGLKMYSKEHLQEIQKFVPTRTVDQVKWFIEREEIRYKSKREPDNEEKINEAERTAPIQLWTHLASDLVSQDVDYSHLVTEVMNIAATLEPHDKKQGASDPDFSAIYQYLVALLKGFDPPDLKPIDAAIILDLMQGMADELQAMDLEKQEQLMKLKYNLLNAKMDIQQPKVAYECAKRAMDDDLLEKEEMQKNSDKYPGNTSGPSTSTDTARASSSVKNSQSQQLPRLGRPIKPQGQEPHKKGVLYTLNPFCIPIKYLQPTPKGKVPLKDK